MRARGRPRLEPRLELAPMVDVVLLLLLFLILTAGATATAGIRIALPTAEHGETSANQGTVLEVTAEGEIRMNETRVLPETLVARLAARPDPTARVIVLADRNAGWGVVVQVWDACVAAGVPRERILLPTERTAPGDEREQ